MNQGYKEVLCKYSQQSGCGHRVKIAATSLAGICWECNLTGGKSSTLEVPEVMRSKEKKLGGSTMTEPITVPEATPESVPATPSETLVPTPVKPPKPLKQSHIIDSLLIKGEANVDVIIKAVLEQFPELKEAKVKGLIYARKSTLKKADKLN